VPLLAAGRLAGPWQRAIHTYKYGRHAQLDRPLAEELGRTVMAAPDRVRALTFVPLHPARQRARGFNQAERLGQRLADLLRLPLYAGLVRERDTPPQVGLDEADRRQNVAGAFRWRGAGPPPYGLGLIDDVSTTGATLSAAAAALAEAGCRPSAYLVLAVAAAQTLAGSPVTSRRILGDTPHLGDGT